MYLFQFSVILFQYKEEKGKEEKKRKEQNIFNIQYEPLTVSSLLQPSAVWQVGVKDRRGEQNLHLKE